MLTPEQIKAIAASRGDTVTATPAIDTSAADAFAKRMNFNPEIGTTDTYVNRVNATEKQAAENVGQSFMEGGETLSNDFAKYREDIKGKNPVEQVLHAFQFARQTAGNIAKTAGEVGLNTAKIAAAPVTQVRTNENLDNKTIGKVAAEGGTAAVEGIVNKLTETHPELIDWVAKKSQENPELARGIGDLFHTLTLGGAGKIAGEGASEGFAKTLKTGVQDLIAGGKNGLEKTKSTVASVKAPKLATLDTNIEAVNPVLKGKQLEGAYEQIATGGRSYAKAGLRAEQTLAPSEQAVKVGTRLHDAGIQLSGNAPKDLETLHGALNTTEKRIEKLLSGKDPEVQYLADKQTLISSLEDIKKNSPLQFKSIKEDGKLHTSVVNFARQVIAESDDSIKGLRDARIKFDAQAKKEFPSAFGRDGTIDTKNAAGRAIKDVRDSINEHLYNTAPEGSEIRKLIQQESDIFRAAKAVSVRASSGEGKNLYQLWSKENPTKAKALEVGVTGAVGGSAASLLLSN